MERRGPGAKSPASGITQAGGVGVMAGDDGDAVVELIGRVLGEVDCDVDAAAERIMRLLGDGAACILALDRLADLAEEARRLADSSEQAVALLRLRVGYRPEVGGGS